MDKPAHTSDFHSNHDHCSGYVIKYSSFINIISFSGVMLNLLLYVVSPGPRTLFILGIQLIVRAVTTNNIKPITIYSDRIERRYGPGFLGKTVTYAYEDLDIQPKKLLVNNKRVFSFFAHKISAEDLQQVFLVLHNRLPAGDADLSNLNSNLAHSHDNSHGHSHGMEGGWDVWGRKRILQVVLVGVCFAALTTVIGVFTLLPDGSGRAEIEQQAADFGVDWEPVLVEVTLVTDADCSFSDPADPQKCRTIEAKTIEDYIPKAERDKDVVNRGSILLAGTIVPLNETPIESLRAPDFGVGDTIVFGYDESTEFFFYADVVRGGSLILLAILFVIVVIELSRFRGLAALLSMGITVFILVAFIAPSVLDGNSPILVSVVGASVIAFVSLYLTHGFTPGTTVALAGTLSALGLTLGLSWVFFELANFTGLATEEGASLTVLATEIDMKALLLGGAIIGALGALDDVTVTQVATVSELHLRNPNLTVADLVTSGIRVGREHIASTVNTLLLAYAGVSMPLLLLFAISNQSLGMVANSEVVAVEIVRTLCGSIGLVAAVPITTFLAALVHSELEQVDEMKAKANRKKSFAFLKILGGALLVTLGIVFISLQVEGTSRRSPLGLLLAGVVLAANGFQDIVSANKMLSQLDSDGEQSVISE